MKTKRVEWVIQMKFNKGWEDISTHDSKNEMDDYFNSFIKRNRSTEFKKIKRTTVNEVVGWWGEEKSPPSRKRSLHSPALISQQAKRGK